MNLAFQKNVAKILLLLQNCSNYLTRDNAITGEENASEDLELCYIDDSDEF